MPGTSQNLPRLSTARLVLRPVKDGDVDAVYTIYSDEVALKYFAREPLESRDEAELMVTEKLVPDLDDKAMVWAISLARDEQMIGTFTLFHIDLTNRRAEVGYILDRSFWGKGYASEALRKMIDYCFTELAFARLEADVDPKNDGSLKLLEKHGFEREGYFKKRWLIRGKWYDSVMFGLLNPASDEIARDQNGK
jgi:ribosomal-protein-alanine N-acetyltransferase